MPLELGKINATGRRVKIAGSDGAIKANMGGAFSVIRDKLENMKTSETEIRFLSDEDSDYALLEKAIARGDFGYLGVHSRILAEQRSPPSVADFIESVRGNIDYSDAQKSFDDYNRARTALPTRYDSPGQFSILTNLISSVLNAATGRGIEISDLPKIATLPTGKINACAVRLQGASSAFLLFDSELLTFCNLFAKAWAQCFPTKEIEDGRFQLDLNYQSIEGHLSTEGQEGIRRFREVLFAISEKGSPTLAPPYPPTPSIVYPMEKIRDVMEWSVVGHELAHYMHGDIDPAFSHIARIAATSGGSNLPKAYIQEHLADAAGTLLALDCAYNDGTHFSLAYLGSECWYGSMLLLERFLRFHSGTDGASWQCPDGREHPSWFKRQQLIRSAAFDWYQEDEVKAILAETISFMDCILDQIWGCLTECDQLDRHDSGN